ncbi:MAG TPA: M23 family metallopeptidase [Terracidiphilus sp.]|jgi:murein DD-endopeptidase MepM/ murein hydrolase activator NlpD|nr:M23 family metallopeptidase [Terracidiphilus sp.]
MLRKRYYILFVARDEDGRVRKIPLPLHYAYGFVAAAVIGAFTIVGLAGSYTRMLLKTESFNQVRAERENLRKNYQQMAKIAHDRDVQVASLGALANEVTALYGLRQSRLAAHAVSPKAAAAPGVVPLNDDVNPQYVKATIDEFSTLRNQAMSGRMTRALESGLSSSYMGDWTLLADAPSLWPIEGHVASGFGERQDPINGEGAFHSGIDIDAPWGTPVRAAGDGVVSDASLGSGYGREITIDHGHDVMTVYGHLSSSAVVPGEHVTRGQIIGYVGQTGRATGPHLHYEVRVHNVPVNPHKYLREDYGQMIAAASGSSNGATGN